MNGVISELETSTKKGPSYASSPKSHRDFIKRITGLRCGPWFDKWRDAYADQMERFLNICFEVARKTRKILTQTCEPQIPNLGV